MKNCLYVRKERTFVFRSSLSSKAYGFIILFSSIVLHHKRNNGIQRVMEISSCTRLSLHRYYFIYIYIGSTDTACLLQWRMFCKRDSWWWWWWWWLWMRCTRSKNRTWFRSRSTWCGLYIYMCPIRVSTKAYYYYEMPLLNIWMANLNKMGSSICCHFNNIQFSTKEIPQIGLWLNWHSHSSRSISDLQWAFVLHKWIHLLAFALALLDASFV